MTASHRHRRGGEHALLGHRRRPGLLDQRERVDGQLVEQAHRVGVGLGKGAVDTKESVDSTNNRLIRALAKRFRHDPELCYLAGLLHDIGRMPVIAALHDRGYAQGSPEEDSPTEIIILMVSR